MRAVDLAILLICLQAGIGIVGASTLFSNTFYESDITAQPSLTDPASISTTEQEQLGFDVFNYLRNILTWGWITTYFEPVYSNVAGVKIFVDAIIVFLNGICYTVYLIALVEVIRNQTRVFGG